MEGGSCQFRRSSVRRRRRKIGEFFLLPLEYSKEFPEIELYGGVARELLCQKELEGGGEEVIGKGGEKSCLYFHYITARGGGEGKEDEEA